MDIDKLIKDYANISADTELGKDISKYALIISENLTAIANHLISHSDDPDNPESLSLMQIGYWFFVFQDSILHQQHIWKKDV